MLTTNYVPGAPIWADLSVPDLGAAGAFYRGLLGWEFVSAGPDAGGYGMFLLDGKTVAAAGPLAEEGAAPAWSLYFHTPDVDATAAAVGQAGGTVLAGPMDVFTAGRMAVFADPLGDTFCVWQPGETKGLDEVTVTGTLCWTELHSSDPERAKAFYASVFGWQSQDVPMGGSTYTLVRPGGAGEEAHQGGIIAAAGRPATGWGLYFEVADCDAAAAKVAGLGGTVVTPPMDVPMAGRFAALTDPAGAAFAIITSELPEDAQAAG